MFAFYRYDERIKTLKQLFYWLQKKEELVSILFEDGFAQVGNVRNNKIWVSYLKQKQDNERTHWVWPDIKEEELVEQDFVMEVYPV